MPVTLAQIGIQSVDITLAESVEVSAKIEAKPLLDKDIRIRATNRVAFASEISMLNSRIQTALNLQRNKMERRLAHYLKQAATRSGFK